MLKIAKNFVHTVMPSVIKPLHVLWNEIIGFFFIIFALGAFSTGWRQWRAIDADPNNVVRLVFTVAFGLTMSWFGVSSFLKARKIRRRGLTVIRSN